MNVNNYESRIEDMSVQLEEYKRLLNDKEKFYSETKQQLKEEI